MGQRTKQTLLQRRLTDWLTNTWEKKKKKKKKKDMQEAEKFPHKKFKIPYLSPEMALIMTYRCPSKFYS